jgi:ankyrin repeat protein
LLICYLLSNFCSLLSVSALETYELVEAERKQRVDKFIVAARNGQVDQLQSVLARGGVCVNAHNAHGFTALYCAVLNNQLAAVRCLLAHGARVNDSFPGGETCVWRAAHSGSVELLQMLLDGGGDANAVTSDGQTALVGVVAAPVGDATAEAEVDRKVRLLLSLRVDVAAVYRGKTAEEWAKAMGRHAIADVIATAAPAAD